MYCVGNCPTARLEHMGGGKKTLVMNEQNSISSGMPGFFGLILNGTAVNNEPNRTVAAIHHGFGIRLKPIKNGKTECPKWK